MVTVDRTSKLDNLHDLRSQALEIIHEHSQAIGVIAEALADVDQAYVLAMDARTPDDWQALRNAEERLARLVAREVSP